jgi:hypothetical protein
MAAKILTHPHLGDTANCTSMTQRGLVGVRGCALAWRCTP